MVLGFFVILLSMDKAEQVVGAFMKAFPQCSDLMQRPSIEAVEQVMRPFAPISCEVQHKIEELFRTEGLDALSVGKHCWFEANFCVSGDGLLHADSVNFLALDPCTCVVPHLEAAIQHSTKQGAIDPRIVQLRDLWLACNRDELEFHKRLHGRGE